MARRSGGPDVRRPRHRPPAGRTNRVLPFARTHFVYTRHNVRPHYANEVIGRAYDIIESQSDVVVHMGRFSLEEFVGKHPDSRNAVILHHIYQYTYQEDISVERARQYLQLPQEAFIVTAFGEFRNCEEIRMVLGAFRSWNEKQKLLLAPASTLSHGTTITAEISSSGGPQKPDTTCSCPCSTA